jgi:hypothetical protein
MQITYFLFQHPADAATQQLLPKVCFLRLAWPPLAASCPEAQLYFLTFSWLLSTIFHAFSISFLSATMVCWSSSLSLSAV